MGYLTRVSLELEFDNFVSEEQVDAVYNFLEEYAGTHQKYWNGFLQEMHEDGSKEKWLCAVQPERSWRTKRRYVV